MLRTPDTSDQVMTTPVRIIALDRARTFITLLVLLHHSAVNYTYFGSGDRMRWLGFDLVVLFNDSFFMACMFLISGLFVRDSLARRGAAAYLANRAWRLGVPYLLSIFFLIPRTSTSCISGGVRSPSAPGRRGRRGSCGCCWRSMRSQPSSGR